MATNSTGKLGEIGRLTFIRHTGIPTQDWNVAMSMGVFTAKQQLSGYIV